MTVIHNGICAYCGKEYQGTQKRYCSAQCRQLASRNRVTLICKHCGKSFDRPTSQARLQFCCNPCRYTYFKEHKVLVRNPPVERKCQICNKSFLVRLPGLKPGNGRFCSQACMLVWRGPILHDKRYLPETHITRKCEWCDREFSVPRSWQKKNWGRFCSRECVGAWTAQTRQQRVSKAETRFADMLESAGLVFNRQARMGTFIVDLYFSDNRLIVEFDGDYWHSMPHIKAKDARKDAYAAKHGYRILHVSEQLFYDDPNATLQLVKDALVI